MRVRAAVIRADRRSVVEKRSGDEAPIPPYGLGLGCMGGSGSAPALVAAAERLSSPGAASRSWRWSASSPRLSVFSRVLCAVTGVLLLNAFCARQAGGQGEAAKPSGATVDGRTFVVQRITEAGIPRTPRTMFGHPLHLSFRAERPRFLASTGCNQLIGDYAIVHGKLVIAPGAGSTLMACIDPKARELEVMMEAFLRASPSLSLDGDRLVLETSSVRLEALDSRIANPDRPLVGTTWQYSGEIHAGGGASGEFGVTVPTLVLGGDGTFVYQGCQRITGRYEQAGAQLTLLPGPGTGSTCADTRAAELESRVLRSLRERTLTAKITGESLSLLRDDGAGLTFKMFATPGH